MDELIGGLIPEEVKNLRRFKDMTPGIYKNVQMIRYMKKSDKYKDILKDIKTNKKMDRWFEEDWVNVKDALKGVHTPCGRSSVTNKEEYPACRPLKRITKDTPITLPELLSQGAKKKIIEAIKQKEQKGRNYRINWKGMVEKKV